MTVVQIKGQKFARKCGYCENNTGSHKYAGR